MTLREWRNRYNAGDFNSADRGVQIGAGWFDWFCPDSELPTRLAELAKPLLRIKDGGKVDLDSTYVMFKNNLTGDGKMYDDLRICNRDGSLFVCTVNEPAVRYKSEAMKWHAHAMDKRYARPYEDAWSFRSMTSLASWLSKPWEDEGRDVVTGWFEITTDEPLTEGDYAETIINTVPEIEGPVLLDPIVEIRGVQTREMAMFYLQNTLSYLLPVDGRMSAVAFPIDGGALVGYATEALDLEE